MPPDDIKSSNEEGVYLYNGCVSGKGYSVGYSLSDLVNETHPTSVSEFFDQIIKLVNELGNEFTGPIAFNSLDIMTGKLISGDEDPSKLRHSMNDLLENINKNDLNISLCIDLVVPDDLNDYSMYQTEIDLFNNVFCNVLQRLYENGVFKPSVILNLHNSDIWTNPILDKYLALAYQYGSPILQNKITSTITFESTRPIDRTIEPDVLYQRIGGPTGNADNTGVLGHICLNLAKMGFDAESEDDFYQIIGKQLDLASDLLEKHRADILSSNESSFGTDLIKENSDWMYSSIVLTGMNEALEYLIDAPLGHVAGKAVTYKVLEYIRIKLEEIQAKSKSLYILESIPSESYNDHLLEVSELTNSYLTRGTELPAYHGDDLWDALEHQKKLQALYTGATLVEVHLKKGLTYHDGCKLLTRRIIDQFGFNYLAVTPSEFGESDSYQQVMRVDGNMRRLESLSKNYKEVHGKRVHHDVKNR